MPTFDLYTTGGALSGALFMLIFGLLRDGKFNPKYIPEYIVQAATGLATPALWKVPDSVSPVLRFVAGFLCGCGGKATVNFLRTMTEAAKAAKK